VHRKPWKRGRGERTKEKGSRKREGHRRGIGHEEDGKGVV
jgi:hypothetical protein